jgi:hypothetical protein
MNSGRYILSQVLDLFHWLAAHGSNHPGGVLSHQREKEMIGMDCLNTQLLQVT